LLRPLPLRLRASSAVFDMLRPMQIKRGALYYSKNNVLPAIPLMGHEMAPGNRHFRLSLPISAYKIDRQISNKPLPWHKKQPSHRSRSSSE
jgi:hypothetical protein